MTQSMGPVGASDYFEDRLSGNMKPDSELWRLHTFGPQHQDLVRLSASELVNAARLGIPSFSRHVLRILFRSADEKVVRVHALGVVANVADEHSIRNDVAMNQPRHACCAMVPADAIDADIEHSVTLTIAGTGPQPTAIGVGRFVHPIKEALEQIMGYSRHVNLLSRLTVPRAVHSSASAFRCLNYTPQLPKIVDLTGFLEVMK